MSNFALILAGGSGNRMGQDIPKQFMHIDGALVIIHMMKAMVLEMKGLVILQDSTAVPDAIESLLKCIDFYDFFVCSKKRKRKGI